jgi:hypothetical protein
MNPFHRLVHALGFAAKRFVCPMPNGKPRSRTILDVKAFEDRVVPSGVEFRSIDGSGNNLANPSWGQAGTNFLRVAPSDYEDGISTASGSDRVSARVISNVIADQAGQSLTSERLLSAMMYAWGQFIDHDLDLTKSGTSESLPIPVPKGDPWFDPTASGLQTIPLIRSAAATGTGTSTANPRQQVNLITPWLDGSMIYGSDLKTALSLRTQSGGLMKTSANNLLPVDSGGMFVAGDIRVNENPGLTSLQTLFVREHNRIAKQISTANPQMNDEEIYQRARMWVIAEIQVITYKEWLPTLTGSAMTPYRGYDNHANPAISNEFSTAGFRIGHSMLGDDVKFLGNDGLPIREGVSLAQAFFNPSLVSETNIDPVLKYLASDPSSEIDTRVVDSVRNFLFGPPGSGGLDLASLNIQRGRDHGLADYNTTRKAYGLPMATNFSQITNDPQLASKLKQLYGSVNNVDLWVGILAENHVANGSVGPTAKAIINEQFNRLRAADRFWYQRIFQGRELQQLESTTLSQVIARNTGLSTVQSNAFVFRAVISGTVFADANRNAQIDREQGLANRTVQLVDALTNEVIATKQTDSRGNFSFNVSDGLRTGRYLVKATIVAGETITTSTKPISVNSDGFYKADIGLFRTPPPRNGNPMIAGRTAFSDSTPFQHFVLLGVGLNRMNDPWLN